MSRRSATRPEIRVGGFRLSSIVPADSGWGELRHSTRTNGAWQVSWKIPNARTWRHPALVYGAPVELMLGPICLAPGELQEPNWDSGEFIAFGSSRAGETAMALDDDGDTSTAPNTVIDAGIARDVLPWTRKDDFGTASVGEPDGDGGVVSIRSVLDAWAQENNSGWAIDNTRARNLIVRSSDESSVDWLIVPGSGVLGSASEERVDRLIVRYRDSTTRRRATIHYAPAGGRVERPLDLTDRGAMTAAKATAIAAGEWAALQGRSGWTNGLTLKRGQITTFGGAEADPAFVKADDTVRLLGVPDPRGVAHNLDVVLGDTEYDWEEDEIQINPVGLAARDDATALEQVSNLALDAMAKANAGALLPGLDVRVGQELVDGTAVAVGGVVAVTVDFPEAFPATPKVVDAQLAGFVSGAGSIQIRQTDQYTATSFRLVLVNLGTAPATWTDLPVKWTAIGGIA